MPLCSVVLDATLLHGIEGCSVASFNTTEQRDIVQHHGAPWLPSTPRSTVASFNTTEQPGILQHNEAVWHPSKPWNSLKFFIIQAALWC
jgi:hypothetical protein